MHNIRKPDFYLAVVGLFLAIAVHWWNGVESSLPFGHHETADDPSYLRPAENLINLGAWKDNTDGRSAYIQRPPGMGLIHLSFYLMLGKWAFIGETILFFLIYGLALYLLPGIFRRFITEKSAIVLTSIYALLPCFWGFLTYSITEALTPTLLILLLACVFSDEPKSLSRIIFLLFVIWMIRPLLILLLPVVFHLLWKRRDELKSSRKNIIVLFACGLLALFWEVRKMVVLDDEGYSLHPIYSETNATPFRPVHESFSNLFRIWETQPEQFHAIMGTGWAGDTVKLRQLLDGYYAERSVPVKKERLLQLLLEYSKANSEVRLLAVDLPPRRLLSELEMEKHLRLKVDQLTTVTKANNPGLYHLYTPLNSARFLLLKSQLNLELFQRYYSETIGVKLLKHCSLIVILLSVIGTLFSLVSSEKILRWLAFGFLLYTFYLCYFQRMNEDRYMIPALPILFIVGGLWWTSLIDVLRTRFSANR